MIPFQRRAVLVAAILMLSGLAPALAAKSASYERDAFKPALDDALQRIQKLHGGRDAKDSTGGNLKWEELSNIATGGAWRVTLGIGCELLGTRNSTSNEYNKLMKLNSAAVVANNRDNVAYAFKTQVVEDIHVEEVEKRIASRRKSLTNEFKDLAVTVERQADKMYLVTGLYSYAGGVTPSDISERLSFLMRESEWLLCDINTGIELSNAGRWKELKGKVSTLTKADFITLYPLFKQSGYAVNNPQNEFGDWQMGGEGYKVWVENRGTDMRLWLRIKQPYGNTPTAKGEAVLAELRALTPAKGAKALEANWDANDIWVGSVYPYSDIKGKQVEETVDYFFNKYAPSAAKDVKKILKRNL